MIVKKEHKLTKKSRGPANKKIRKYKKLKKRKTKHIKKNKKSNTQKKHFNQNGGKIFDEKNIYVISAHGTTTKLNMVKPKYLDIDHYPNTQLIYTSDIGQVQLATHDYDYFEYYKNNIVKVINTEVFGFKRYYKTDSAILPSIVKIDDILLSWIANFKVGIYPLNGPNPFCNSRIDINNDINSKCSSKGDIDNIGTNETDIQQYRATYGHYGPYTDNTAKLDDEILADYNQETRASLIEVNKIERLELDLNNIAQTALNKSLYVWLHRNNKYEICYLSELLNFLNTSEYIDINGATFILLTCRALCFQSNILDRGIKPTQFHNHRGIKIHDETKLYIYDILLRMDPFDLKQLLSKVVLHYPENFIRGITTKKDLDHYETQDNLIDLIKGNEHIFTTRPFKQITRQLPMARARSNDAQNDLYSWSGRRERDYGYRYSHNNNNNYGRGRGYGHGHGYYNGGNQNSKYLQFQKSKTTKNSSKKKTKKKIKNQKKNKKSLKK